MPQFHKGFTWTLSQSTLKTKNTFINLRQTLTPNQGRVFLKIDNERELQYNNDLGWNWHKSWNIQIFQSKFLCETKNAHNGLIVQLMAVKKLQNDLFEDIGLEGITQYDIVDGKAFFSGVKLNSTTYNHQGHRFQLLMLLKVKENIVLGLETQPIFVDSRKSARDEHRQIQYISPFEPRYLEHNFCKKEKHFNDVINAPIENNENGLHNYLTAPNIRNKIKHPLFMALKFSRCFYVYHKHDLVTNNYLIEFQQQLMSKFFSSNNNRIKKKIEESLTQLFGQSKVSIVEKKYFDEEQYKKLQFSSDDYISVSNSLQQLMNELSQKIEFVNQQQQQIQQSIQQEQQQQIKFRYLKPTIKIIN